jgi:hypothetical protein
MASRNGSGEGFYTFFIPAECESFVDPGVELPFELGK